MKRLAEILAGLLLTRLLSRLGGRRGRRSRAPAAAVQQTTSAPPRPAATHAPRGRLAALMLTSFVIGAVLMIGFEAAITRVLGMALLMTFIVSGVWLIADPDLLAPDDEG